MMNTFMFEASDTVLLLGEGNFSFSCCLLRILEERKSLTAFPNVISTCLQKHDLSETALENIKFLKDKGAKTFLGIDATNLENEHLLVNLTFDKVIFNFPHIGGKMKIHLNRQLLCNFFASVSSVLSSGGDVLVSLCAGQGGTEFEGIQRRWDDTWQIVEQAAHGDFVLVNIDYFPSSIFKDYKSVGYRGIEKSFNTGKSVVHVFRKGVPLITEISDKIDLFSLVPIELNGNILISIAHKRAIDNNPFKNENSPQSFLMNYLVKSFEYSVDQLTVVDDLPLYTDFDIAQAYCRVNNRDYSLRRSLVQVIPNSLVYDNCIMKGLVFGQFQSDFRNFVNCEVVLKGDCSKIIEEFLSDIILKLNAAQKLHKEKNCWYLSSDSSNTLVALSNTDNTFTVYLDALSSCVFCATYKQLWEIGCQVSGTTLKLPSLYPRSYSFDVSFLCKNNMDMSKIFYALHQLPENIIESAHLISVYEFDNSDKSYCIRITYRSYSKPIHRKVAIKYHECVMGTLISHSLNLKVI